MFLVSLFLLSELDAALGYSYQTEPLFLSFSDLAALERKAPFSFVVKCHEDGVEILITPHLEPQQVRLGRTGAGRCKAEASGDRKYVIRAHLTDCGAKVTLTQSSVLYDNLLLYASRAPASPGDEWKVGGASVPVRCEYPRRFSVSSGALRPTWTPLISVRSVHLHLDFHLRLMTGDWRSERKSSVYFLGETVNVQASVNGRHHLPLRLYAYSCVATLTPDADSYPRYPFIDHRGCFTDSQLRRSGSRFLPRVQDQLLQIQLEPFLFHQDHRHAMYITCYLEAEPVSNRVPVRRACSYNSGRWRSADGDDRLCESCSSADGHKRAPRSKTKHRQTGIQCSCW